MPVVFDASFLIPLLDPKVQGHGDVDARIDSLFRTLDKVRKKIIVPTPVLCEVLIGAEQAAPRYLDIIGGSSRFKIVPFDVRAAVEAAAAHREALRGGDKKEGARSWPKVKFDRQIVAIAKVEGADTIYSNDDDIVRFAARDKIQVVTLAMLPAPADEQQGALRLGIDENDAQ
jgi:predicted nucleic acid-binding protein